MANEYITVDDFVHKYNGDMSVIQVKEYIPINTKRVLIDALIEKIIHEDGIVTTYDSIEKQMIFTLGLICSYTNLKAVTSEDYDLLVDTGLIENFTAMNKDMVNFEYYFNLRLEDYMRDRNTGVGILNKVLKRAKDFMGSFNEEDLQNLADLINSLDIKKLVGDLNG